jgi:hypothetical protein
VAKATVSTIGFTKTTAEGFFERLLNAGVKKVVDVRLETHTRRVPVDVGRGNSTNK